ncbi:hypothetical protein MnTg01_01311 [archaeon MnTg01]|nr:hypothetical protein MnTg01_01311 [archaeon MnTg01]
MIFMTKPGTIIKIQLLQCSNAKDYFESKERLFLGTVLSKLQNNSFDGLNLSSEEKNMLNMIFDKYKKYL